MMNLLKMRKVRFFIALFSMLLLFDMIQDSYAKYVSSASAGSTMTIAKWAFKVNDQDVLDNRDFSDTIVPVFEGSSYIAPGVIAPGSEGYFDIEIDASDTDVNFTETITLALAEDNSIRDLRIIGYSINGGEFTEFETTTSISNDRSYTDTNKVNTYRIYVKWIDGTGERMNNAADTEASRTGIASVSITTRFIQRVN